MNDENARKTAIALHAMRIAMDRLSAQGRAPHIANLSDLAAAEGAAPFVMEFALDPGAYVERTTISDESIDELLAFVMEAAMVDAQGKLNPHMVVPESAYERGRMRKAVRVWLELCAQEK